MEAGLLIPHPKGGGRYLATPAAQEFARAVLAMQGTVAQTLWGDSAQVEHLVGLADQHIDAARDRPLAELPAFHRQLAVLPTTNSWAHALLARLTVLRYLRADVHAGVLAEFGLSGPVARALHWVWRGTVSGEQLDGSDAPAAWALEELVTMTYVEAGPTAWSLTNAGRSARERIEAMTNQRMGELATPIPARARMALLDGLGALEGDDPRPPRAR